MTYTIANQIIEVEGIQKIKLSRRLRDVIRSRGPAWTVHGVAAKLDEIWQARGITNEQRGTVTIEGRTFEVSTFIGSKVWDIDREVK